jgi:hypothetical protein
LNLRVRRGQEGTIVCRVADSAVVLALCLTFILFRLNTAVTGGLRLDAVQSRNLPFKLRYQVGYWDLSDLKVKVAKIGEGIAAKVFKSSGGHSWMEHR